VLKITAKRVREKITLKSFLKFNSQKRPGSGSGFEIRKNAGSTSEIKSMQIRTLLLTSEYYGNCLKKRSSSAAGGVKV
jgi:hypothetical protein